MKRTSFVAVVVLLVSMQSCRGPEGPTGLSADELLTDPATQPRVIYTYPEGNSQGPYPDYNNHILIRFNKIMDRATMEHGVHLSSSSGDVVLDTNSVSSQSTDVFSFAPVDVRGSSFKFLWKLGQSYTLSIDPTVQDVNGNTLHGGFSMSFTPETYFRVATISPSNGSTEIFPSSSVTLSFNSPVDSSIFSKIHINPSLTGEWTFIPRFPVPDSTTIRFSFTKALVDMPYTVTVDAGARDKDGNQMPQQFVSSFRTITFRVTSTLPLNGSTVVSMSNGIQMFFTLPVDTTTIRNAFTISPDVAGHFIFGKGGPSALVYSLDHRLSINTAYTVTLNTTLASTGGLHLAQPYSFTFATAPFQVISTYPSDGIAYVPLNSSITLTLSDLIDTGSVRSSFSINPAVEGNLTLRDNSSSFTFIPTNGLSGKTIYTVTLSTGMRSFFGDTLISPMSYSFMTAPFSILSTSPQNGEIDVYGYRGISINVNGGLDTGTIRTSFSISPPVAGTFEYQYYQYLDNNRLAYGFTFRPTNPLASSTTYSVTISSSLRSANGENLSAPYVFSFTTAPFKVIYTDPYNGAINQSINSYIRINFSGPLDTTGINSAFTMSPTTAGNISTYQGNNFFTFYSSNGLKAGTQYVVTVQPTLRSTTGEYLSSSYTFSFTTAPFKVTYSYPPDGSNNVSLYNTIGISFSVPPDTTGIYSNITINPPLAGSFSHYPGNTYITFYPLTELAPNTLYSVAVSPTLKSVNGDVLGTPYSFIFTTASFQITYEYPHNGSIGIERSTGVQFSFNAYLDQNTIPSSFSIVPNVAGSLTGYGSHSTSFLFHPDSVLDANTTYTVTVSPDLKSIGGATLPSAHTLTFTTGN